MRILGVLARVAVPDIDEALPLYRRLTGEDEVRRFGHGRIELAWVGSFLLLSGDPDALAAVSRVATLLVDDIDDAHAAVTQDGGEILEPPAEAPNGRRMIARHADGSVFEYIEQRSPD